MADVVAPDVRSRMMAGIRGKNTKPELILRHGLHRLGFRFSLHKRSLPGSPDLAFPKYRAVLFAHGCFWHRHDCHLFKQPSTRSTFWKKKLAKNQQIDRRTEIALRNAGWRVGVVWECALKGRHRLETTKIITHCAAWLRSDRPTLNIRGRK